MPVFLPVLPVAPARTWPHDSHRARGCASNCLRKDTKFFRIKTQITSFFTNITYYIIQISAKNMQNHDFIMNFWKQLWQ